MHRARPHVVLGFKLRPFSFWHAAQLDFIGSPFAAHRAPFDFTALYLAAQICQTRYPRTPSSARWLSRLRKKVTVLRFMRGRFLAELNKFSSYQRDYASSPEYITSEAGGSVKTPWYLYSVALLLEMDSSLTKAQGWDSTVGEARWWSAARAEARGAKVDLITPADRGQLRDLNLDVA